MIELAISIPNLDKLRANAAKAPTITLKWLGKATEAALFEVEKEAVDRNFQFKTPRAERTGMLERSFKFGRYLHPSKLKGSIGPTVRYAPYVYFGTRHGLRPNRFMDRIARASEAAVSRHFEKAVEEIVKDIAV